MAPATPTADAASDARSARTAPRPSAQRTQERDALSELRSTANRRQRATAAPGIDEFYTNAEVAAACMDDLVSILPDIGLAWNSCRFIEPSAGSGAFFDLLPATARIGFDINPRHPLVQLKNFLEVTSVQNSASTVVVGNPPFGRRGHLATQFINHAATIADTIAFILPATFRKYTAQRSVAEDLRLIFRRSLPRESFHTPQGSAFGLNSDFQVWSRRSTHLPDQRFQSRPPIEHPDFVLHQYNNTVAARHVFLMDFDFAVPCQGWQDYSRRETDSSACELSKQWMLFKATSPTVANRLYGIDFDDLAHRDATTTPGFRKVDVVAEYVAQAQNAPRHVRI